MSDDKPHVLVVEDDGAVRNSLKRSLEFNGFEVSLASDGAEALASIGGLTPDLTSAATLSAGFNRFLWGMLLIFLFAGIGNASTFKQMPMIFEPRQAGGVIGWTAAIAAFGPFLFGIGLTTLGVVPFYWIGVVWAVLCVALTWWRYARPGAPKPS